ncbi:zf-HC2 domain-containing protein [Micromonospora sp. NPDC049559]|uniref:anti-sigma factor family protein n=1 Tax=Micromonospora sp. NPDC049559 TaxID=3155923 RepID=UPI003428E6B8
MRTPDRINSADDHVDLGGYLTESLDPDERRQVEEHLAGCAACRAEVESLREWADALQAVPDAMLLDGPPEGGDLLLQRTLRQIRNESAGNRTRRTALVASAAAVVVAAAISAGVVIGRVTNEPATPTALPTPSASAPTAAPGTRFASASDPITGARITVAVAPSPGWIKLTAAVAGIPAGQRCRLLVVGKDGTTVLAGSWLVSQKGAAEGTTLDGTALIDPDQVAQIRVENTDGMHYTSVNL